ncbi:hypothetical protein ALC57_00198 [Trachymyrmex cornetzi]|uniref:General transcription factor II-I repeat domain-containing protein 2 n=1 Tax=Trachymyrmex cornetzi TaxID=471704 RepID=A0A151JSH5_9HYME|nr:hypothetical protein ALC57_00198 [Trachymyrmex cornetzi]
MNRYVQSFDKVWKEIFFASINNKTTCLLCGYQPSVVKKYVLHRHYNIKHSNEYSTKCVGQEKHDLIQGLKLVYQEGSISDIEDCSSSSDTTSSIKALTASYAISNLIGKHSKPFTEGKFVKEYMVAAVQSFGNLLTLQEAASIPLSAKAVKSRINGSALSLEEKLKSSLQSCSFFSLCLNESTDNRHVSQLSLNASDYPSLRNCGLRIFSMFGSTYLCECSFSKMKLIKNDKRSSLSDASLSSLMRITSSKISVDVPSLVESCKRPRKSN